MSLDSKKLKALGLEMVGGVLMEINRIKPAQGSAPKPIQPTQSANRATHSNSQVSNSQTTASSTPKNNIANSSTNDIPKKQQFGSIQQQAVAQYHGIQHVQQQNDIKHTQRQNGTPQNSVAYTSNGTQPNNLVPERRISKLRPENSLNIPREQLKPSNSGRPNPFFKYLTKEDFLNIDVANYLNDNYPNVLWWHTPNEGKRSNFERYKATLLGMRSGVPDITIAEPKFGRIGNQQTFLYAGLFIELKTEEEKISPVLKKKSMKRGKLMENQRAIIEILNNKKYKAVICYSLQQAKQVIDEYLRK